MTATKAHAPRRTLDQIVAEFLTKGAIPIPGESWTLTGKTIEYGKWRQEQHLIFRATVHAANGSTHFLEPRHYRPTAASKRSHEVAIALYTLRERLGAAVGAEVLITKYCLKQGVPIPETELEESVAGALISTVHRWALSGSPAEQAVAKWLLPRVEHMVRMGARPRAPNARRSRSPTG